MAEHRWYIARTWDLSEEQAAALAAPLLESALPGPELTAAAAAMIVALEPARRSSRAWRFARNGFRRAAQQHARLGSEKIVLGCYDCARDYRSAAGGPCDGAAEEVA